MFRCLVGLLPLPFAAALAGPRYAVRSLQLPHPDQAPASVLSSLAQDCKTLGIESSDVYGDFDASKETSYLRKFEAEVAQEFGMQDAVFMPSGVMAQSIALLIHSAGSRDKFACHDSSHLLLHEQDGYKHLLHMDPVVIATPVDGFRQRPLLLEDIKQALPPTVAQQTSTLIVELPHRELGGKCTPWQDVLGMRDYCNGHGIKFHCDGARIFEATVGYNKSLKELAEPFDSMYISFYKGLAGLSGAMLMGSMDFCDQARKWLRRFGGNLYTLLPYAVSGWSGYRRHWVNPSMSFRDKHDKLVRIVETLSTDDEIHSCLSFDPQLPEVNMIHCYLRYMKEECLKVAESVENETGIRVLTRLRDIESSEPAYKEGYRSKFEWTVGDGNGVIEDDAFIKGWKVFVAALGSNEK